MNMKVMNRVAIGTLFAASAALGITNCGRSGHRNVDNILSEDTVEITTNPQEEIEEDTVEITTNPQEEIEEDTSAYVPPNMMVILDENGNTITIPIKEAPISKPEEISYERNTRLDRRIDPRENDGEIAHNYKIMGTYGATLYYAAVELYNAAARAITEYEQPIGDKIREHARNWKMDEKNVDGYDEWRFYRDSERECNKEWMNHQEELLAEIEEKLFSEGTPTATQCMTYLTRKLAGMDYVSNEDYDKVQRDLERYKKEQGLETTQTKAELMRYMQFKIENLYQKNMLERRGLLKNLKIRKSFEESTKSADEVFLERIHPDYE